MRSQSENENSEFPGAKGCLGWNPKQLLSRLHLSKRCSQVWQPYSKSIARQVRGSDLLQPCIILHKEGMVVDADLAPFEDFMTSSEVVLNGPNLYLSHH